MVTLRQSGLRKVKDGVTSLEEVARETLSDALPRLQSPAPARGAPTAALGGSDLHLTAGRPRGAR